MQFWHKHNSNSRDFATRAILYRMHAPLISSATEIALTTPVAMLKNCWNSHNSTSATDNNYSVIMELFDIWSIEIFLGLFVNTHSYVETQASCWIDTIRLAHTNLWHMVSASFLFQFWKWRYRTPSIRTLWRRTKVYLLVKCLEMFARQTSYGTHRVRRNSRIFALEK